MSSKIQFSVKLVCTEFVSLAHEVINLTLVTDKHQDAIELLVEICQAAWLDGSQGVEIDYIARGAFQAT